LLQERFNLGPQRVVSTAGFIEVFGPIGTGQLDGLVEDVAEVVVVHGD
jgi:hypothetical protein